MGVLRVALEVREGLGATAEVAIQEGEPVLNRQAYARRRLLQLLCISRTTPLGTAGWVGRAWYCIVIPLCSFFAVAFSKPPSPTCTRSDPLPDVRQSSFALVGDLASGCVAHLLPVLDPLVAACLAQLELPRISEDSLAACNNACWSLGEVLIKVDTERVAHSAGERQPEACCVPACLWCLKA